MKKKGTGICVLFILSFVIRLFGDYEDVSMRGPEDFVLFRTYRLFAATKKNTRIDIPDFQNKPSIVVNRNKTFFTKEEMKTKDAISFKKKDRAGRAVEAVGCISRKTLFEKKKEPSEKFVPSGRNREKVKKSGHFFRKQRLISVRLFDTESNPGNLITGTSYLAERGMRPYERKVEAYVKRTGDHVMYRVTPIFKTNDLIPEGVLLEAKSVEDEGKGLQFAVYCYNVQPDIKFSYRTGNLSERRQKNKEKKIANRNRHKRPIVNEGKKRRPSDSEKEKAKYIINMKTGKFHNPSCRTLKRMTEEGKLYSHLRREELLKKYEACKVCKP